MALTLTPRPAPEGKKGLEAFEGDRRRRGHPGDPARIEALREWRRRRPRAASVPAYVVLHDRTLTALAAALPSTLDALAEIPGIGPAKLEAYGRDLIALLGAAGA